VGPEKNRDVAALKKTNGGLFPDESIFGTPPLTPAAGFASQRVERQ